MTGSGRDVWDLLARPLSTEDLVSALSERFAVDPATIRDDVVALVARLAGGRSARGAARAGGLSPPPARSIAPSPRMDGRRTVPVGTSIRPVSSLS